MEKTNIEANEKYQRMLSLAYVDGVAIKARVTNKAGRLLGFLVKGKGNAEYHVTAMGNALKCDCKAGQQDTYCKHRAYCTHAEIERKAAAEKAAEDYHECEWCGDVADCSRSDVQGNNWYFCTKCWDEKHSRAAASVAQGYQGVHCYR